MERCLEEDGLNSFREVRWGWHISVFLALRLWGLLAHRNQFRCFEHVTVSHALHKH